MQILNLTPHIVKIHLNDSHRIILPETGQVARVKFTTRYLRTINEIPVHERLVERINALPKPKAGVIYVVSSILQDNIDEDRDDLVTPSRSSAWLSSDGRIMETSRLEIFRRWSRGIYTPTQTCAHSARISGAGWAFSTWRSIDVSWFRNHAWEREAESISWSGCGGFKLSMSSRLPMV